MRNAIEWATSVDALQMLDWLGDKISPRKKRLFGCALCHRLGHLLRDKPAYAAIKSAEQYADGLLNDKNLWHAYNLAYSSLCQCKPEWEASYYARCAVVCITLPDAQLPITMVLGNFRRALQIAAEKRKTDAARHAFENARKIEAGLLRDIAGSPFLQDNTAWEPATNGMVKSKAESIYAHRRFDLLPELADHLEASGCASQEVLQHCRQPSEHTRGCWVIDSLLHKS